MNNATDLIIFGGTGDLALRKLMPALYRAQKESSLPNNTFIYPTCRTQKQVISYLQVLEESLTKYLSKDEFDKENWDKFATMVSPVSLDITTNDGDWKLLQQKLTDSAQRIFYFSIAPSLFTVCCQQLSKFNLINDNSRVVVEKPIGYDRKSAHHINLEIGRYFDESQIFRIDHYLGKETVQNLLILRFSNLLFENMWNRDSVDHIQITISETVGLEGRAGFYNDTGALRDMVQNHLLQLLCLVAMEPPNQLDGDCIRTEKIKVLKSLQKISDDDVKLHTVRAQYVSGKTENKFVPGYLEELDKSESFCETFVAIRAFVNNWRWSGVPFYLRTGKRLKQRSAEIVVQFKPVSHSIYPNSAGVNRPNKLTIRLQPDEKIQLQLTSRIIDKVETKLHPVTLDLNLTKGCNNYHSDAYKRLLLDVINNDASLFIHREEIDSAWSWIDPIISGWNKTNYQPELYRSGSWGPKASDELLQQDSRAWCNHEEEQSDDKIN